MWDAIIWKRDNLKNKIENNLSPQVSSALCFIQKWILNKPFSWKKDCSYSCFSWTKQNISLTRSCWKLAFTKVSKHLYKFGVSEKIFILRRRYFWQALKFMKRICIFPNIIFNLNLLGNSLVIYYIILYYNLERRHYDSIPVFTLIICHSDRYCCWKIQVI